MSISRIYGNNKLDKSKVQKRSVVVMMMMMMFYLKVGIMDSNGQKNIF